jgi:hypothetical protein
VVLRARFGLMYEKKEAARRLRDWRSRIDVKPQKLAVGAQLRDEDQRRATW